MKLSTLPNRLGNGGAELVLSGERTNGEGKPIGNRILLSLPESEYQTLRPFLSFAQMQHHDSLHEPGERLEFAYFPNRGLVSLVVAMKEGKTVEAKRLLDLSHKFGTRSLVKKSVIFLVTGDKPRQPFNGLTSKHQLAPNLEAVHLPLDHLAHFVTTTFEATVDVNLL